MKSWVFWQTCSNGCWRFYPQFVSCSRCLRQMLCLVHYEWQKNQTCIKLKSKCLGSCFSMKYLMLFSSFSFSSQESKHNFFMLRFHARYSQIWWYASQLTVSHHLIVLGTRGAKWLNVVAVLGNNLLCFYTFTKHFLRKHLWFHAKI